MTTAAPNNGSSLMSPLSEADRDRILAAVDKAFEARLLSCRTSYAVFPSGDRKPKFRRSSKRRSWKEGKTSTAR